MDGLEAVIDRIASNVPSHYEDGDYYEDGILYCGKCNTAKQCTVEFIGIKKTVPCLCECKAENARAEEARERREKLRTTCFRVGTMKSFTFANDDGTNETVTQAAKNYVENFSEFLGHGRGLLFYGSVGTGKSYTAACIANALIDKDYPVKMTNFAEIINDLQGKFEGKQAYIDHFNKYALLIIDDLSAERETEFAQEQVFNVIDSRYRARLPLIITTNLTLDELKKPDSTRKSRLYDRLLEMCFPIEVQGKSRRRQSVRENYDEIKKLLGI